MARNIFAPHENLHAQPTQQQKPGFMGQAGNFLSGVDPSILTILGANLMAASQKQYRGEGGASVFGRGILGGMSGIAQHQSQKQRSAYMDEQIKASKAERDSYADQARNVQGMAQGALKTLDVDGDGNISPQEQARGQYLRMAATTGDPQYLDAAADILKGLGPKDRKTIMGPDKNPYYIDDQTRVLPNVNAPDEGGGIFGGTGMEAQALNQHLSRFPEGPERQAEALRLSRERLARDQTMPTPQGTYVIPGYSGLGGVQQQQPQQQPQAGFIPKPVSEGESRDRYAANSMLSAEQSVASVIEDPTFDPTSGANKLAQLPFFGNLFASENYQQYRSGADEFATNLVFLRSGATARQEEKDTSFENFWPQPWDKPGTVLYKTMIRKQQMTNAYSKGYREGRIVDPQAQENMGLLNRQRVAAEAKYKSFQTTNPDYKPPPEVGEVRSGYKFKGGDPGDPNSWAKQ